MQKKTLRKTNKKTRKTQKGGSNTHPGHQGHQGHRNSFKLTKVSAFKKNYNPTNNMDAITNSLHYTHDMFDSNNEIKLAKLRILSHTPNEPRFNNAVGAKKVHDFLLFKSRHTNTGELSNHDQKLASYVRGIIEKSARTKAKELHTSSSI